MPAFKTPPQITSTTAVIDAAVTKQGITSNTGQPVMLIGSFATTGAPFQRAFPHIAQAEQWLAQGGAADVDATNLRVVSIPTFTQ